MSSSKYRKVVWFTGLSGAGKTTLSALVAGMLQDLAVPVVRLDGDELRAGVSRDLGFTPEDRAENVRRAATLAASRSQADNMVLVALISPMIADRAQARQIIEASGATFIEVYVNAPLAVAETRDPKGLYKRARRGELQNFTGIDAPYEPPISPALTIHTDSETPARSAARVLTLLL